MSLVMVETSFFLFQSTFIGSDIPDKALFKVLQGDTQTHGQGPCPREAYNLERDFLSLSITSNSKLPVMKTPDGGKVIWAVVSGAGQGGPGWVERGEVHSM